MATSVSKNLILPSRACLFFMTDGQQLVVKEVQSIIVLHLFMGNVLLPHPSTSWKMKVKNWKLYL